MQIPLLDNPLISQIDFVKKAKQLFLKNLKATWKKELKALSFDQALDFAIIWESTPIDDRKSLCKKLNLRYLKTFKSVLKQLKPPSRKKNVEVNDASLESLAKVLTPLAHHEKLFTLWIMPELTAVKKTVGLSSKNTIEEALAAILQYQNFNELSYLAQT